MHTLTVSYSSDVPKATFEAVAKDLGYEFQNRAFDQKGTGAHFSLSHERSDVHFVAVAKDSSTITFMLETPRPTWVFVKMLDVALELQKRVGGTVTVEGHKNLRPKAAEVMARVHWRERPPADAMRIDGRLLLDAVEWNSTSKPKHDEHGADVAIVRVMKRDGAVAALVFGEDAVIIPVTSKILYITADGGKLLDAQVAMHDIGTRVRVYESDAWLVTTEQHKALKEAAEKAEGPFLQADELQTCTMSSVYGSPTFSGKTN